MCEDEWPFLDVEGIVLSVIDPDKAKERAELAVYRVLSCPAAVNYVSARDGSQDHPQD